MRIGASDWLIDLRPRAWRRPGHSDGRPRGRPPRYASTPLLIQAPLCAELMPRPLAPPGDRAPCRLQRAHCCYQIKELPGQPLMAKLQRPKQHEIINARELHNLRSCQAWENPRPVSLMSSPASAVRETTLAFDILFNEGQRRYSIPLNAHARSIVQPAGDGLRWMRVWRRSDPRWPSRQRLGGAGTKEHRGTTTEVWHYRLFYVSWGAALHARWCGGATANARRHCRAVAEKLPGTARHSLAPWW